MAERFEAADRDLEARHALFAGHRRRAAGAHRLEECDQLGAQRLVVTDRQMPHRIAAVGLEAETFGDLARQQIAHDIFAAGRDRDVARLERRQPVGVDMREHAGGGAELQQRDVLALGDRAGELRLHLDDVGFGEPADQVDVVDGEVDDDADIRHARRERADAGDGDRENVLARDRLLDGGDRRIEALDMADHQRDAGAARGVDDVASLFHRGRDRLFDHHVDLARDAGERDLVMQMGGSSDRHRIDAFVEQRIQRVEGTAADELGGARAMRLQRIDHADQIDAGQPRQHARMVAAHHAGADDADPKCIFRPGFHTRPESVGTHFIDPDQIKRETPRRFLARRHTCGECRETYARTRFDAKNYIGESAKTIVI